jgi:Protein of unknown function (DUF3551)
MSVFGKLAILAATVASAFVGAQTASADPYKWCAVGTGVGGGGTNCGYMTYEQCLASTRGSGGFCQPNAFYTGSDETAPKKVKKKKTN